MLEIDIDISDVERAWNDAITVVSDGTRESVRKAVLEGAEEARTTRRFKDRSHDLINSIEGRPGISVPGGAEGEIEATAPHASYVDAGTEPHTIEPRRREAMHWQDDGGEHHFARRVNHPGTRADGFMGRAAQKAERVLEREIELAAQRAEAVANR